MNQAMAHAHESHFGPPSQPIDVAQFIQSAVALKTRDTKPTDVFSHEGSFGGLESLADVPEAAKNAIEEECSVEDVASTVTDLWEDPVRLAHVLNHHEATVSVIHESADTTSKRKRKRAMPDPSHESPEIKALQDRLENIRLKSWNLYMQSALFMRAPKNTDHNVLSEVKQVNQDSTTAIGPTTHEALITLTVHNRLAWGHKNLARSSQHAILASQSLGDLFDVIPCTSNEIPEEIVEDGRVVGYEKGSARTESSGHVMCVEGVAYGDGQSEEDYADKLIKHLDAIPAKKRPPITKGATSMHDTPFASLTLRLNEPYWLLHEGNCEHFIVVDQIRLQHPTDPASGYPLTLHMTPPLLDLCRICAKVPAVLSIVGDIRLGESPCVVCDPCWRHMGDANDDEGIIVVPLPKYEHGW
ncbi:hypothetical protein PLICRDRAFT_37596 [Plicaturopsis crispa FD-325 SS-3]|nr:hypothetical protein PLICRDRAFT_37596 [Plicaturopsis crispa FD-325 SS-3]